MKARIVTAALAVLLVAPPAIAADAKGDWIGSLQINASSRLRLRVSIAPGDGGQLGGWLDSIDQGASGFPLSDIMSDGTALSFSVPSVTGRFEGKWDAARKGWAGQWTQGAPLPLFLAAAPPPPALPVPPAIWSIPTDGAIGAMLERRLAGRSGAGLVAGVSQNGRHRLIARGPVGSTAFNGSTLFEIGSISKVFTSLLLADMAVRGEVSLDDPAEKYLPAGHKMPELGGRKITLRDLATHRSGLTRLPNLAPVDPANPYADFDEKRLLDFLDRHQLRRAPGSRYEYSNLGVGLLGYLLGRRAGTSYEELLKTRITGPLGMRDTVITLDPGQRRRFAQGYGDSRRPAKPWDFTALAGAGAIRSTVNDLFLLLDALSGSWRTSLAPAISLMLERRLDTGMPATTVGLALHVTTLSGKSLVWHNGGTGGYRSMMAFDPATRTGAIVLSNETAGPAPDDLVRFLLLGLPIEGGR
jgi:CubicO group peptidase (beta-lactamase class C family)